MRTIEEVVEDLKRLTLHSAPIDFLLNEILEIHKVGKRKEIFLPCACVQSAKLMQ